MCFNTCKPLKYQFTVLVSTYLLGQKDFLRLFQVFEEVRCIYDNRCETGMYFIVEISCGNHLGCKYCFTEVYFVRMCHNTWTWKISFCCPSAKNQRINSKRLKFLFFIKSVRWKKTINYSSVIFEFTDHVRSTLELNWIVCQFAAEANYGCLFPGYFYTSALNQSFLCLHCCLISV